MACMPVSLLKMINRQKSVTDVGGVKVPVQCILSDDALYLCSFAKNIFYGLKVIDQT